VKSLATRPMRLAITALVILAGGAGLVGTGRWGQQVEYWREEAGIAQPQMATSIKDIPVQELTGIVLGALMAGFRSQAANFCWWKSQQYWEEEGHWPRVLPMMKAACVLDPYFPEFWEVTSWHEAYNLAAEYEIRDLPQDQYIDMGIKTLTTGLLYNPHAVQLYELLGWTYRDKRGDLDKAIYYSRQAATVFHVRAEVTKQTAIIQPRFVAHMYEEAGKPDEALLQYQELMIDHPEDSVGIGATLTIRDRYLEADRARRQSRLVEAERLVRLHLHDDPMDKIGLHMLAQIREAKGDTYGALAAWEAGAMVWKDTFAQRKYVESLRLIGRDQYQLQGIPKKNMLIAKRVADHLLQPRQILGDGVMQRGCGVVLRYIPRGGTERPLNPETPLRPGDVLVAKPEMYPGPQGVRAVFYYHGREIGQDSEPPYTTTITEDMLPNESEVSGLTQFAKVELFVPSEQPKYPARFDLREIKMQGRGAPGPSPVAPPSSPMAGPGGGGPGVQTPPSSPMAGPGGAGPGGQSPPSSPRT